MQLTGLRVAVIPEFGDAVVAPAVLDAVITAAEALISSAQMRRVDATVSLPSMGLGWALAGAAPILMELGDR